MNLQDKYHCEECKWFGKISKCADCKVQHPYTAKFVLFEKKVDK